MGRAEQDRGGARGRWSWWLLHCLQVIRVLWLSAFLLTTLALLPPGRKRAAKLQTSGLRMCWAGQGSGTLGMIMSTA